MLKMKLKDFFGKNKFFNTFGEVFEIFKEFFIVILTLLLFSLTLNALYDIEFSIFLEKYNLIDLIPKFLYIFILTELFRLNIIYLTEIRIDTSQYIFVSEKDFVLKKRKISIERRKINGNNILGGFQYGNRKQLV